MDFEVIGDERLVAVVNPTRMRVQADVEINGVFQHTFDPGCLDGRGKCVKFCSEERAEKMVATNPQTLRKFSVQAGRALLAKSRQSGDFFKAWGEIFGPVPMQADYVKAQQARERADLVSKLAKNGIHGVSEMSLEMLRRYAANPSAYWDDKVEGMHLDEVADLPPEPAQEQNPIPDAVGEPDDNSLRSSLNGMRAVLKAGGVKVPPNAGEKWMGEKLAELESSRAAALGLAGADPE